MHKYTYPKADELGRAVIRPEDAEAEVGWTLCWPGGRNGDGEGRRRILHGVNNTAVCDYGLWSWSWIGSLGLRLYRGGIWHQCS